MVNSRNTGKKPVLRCGGSNRLTEQERVYLLRAMDDQLRALARVQALMDRDLLGMALTQNQAFLQALTSSGLCGGVRLIRRSAMLH